MRRVIGINCALIGVAVEWRLRRPTELRRALAARGVHLSVQAINKWTKGGRIAAGRLCDISEVLNLNAAESAALYAEHGVPLPASILALIPVQAAPAAELARPEAA